MSDPLYTRAVLRWAADAHGAGHLQPPMQTGDAYNSACSDRVHMEIALDGDGRVRALAHDTHACVLAQASASILGLHAEGLDAAAAGSLHALVAAMLKGGTIADGAFSAYEDLRAAAAPPGRHRCVLLPIDALLAAFAQG